MTYQNNTSETSTFYRVPKALFTDSCFQDISLSAKMLYALLLDRLSLSARNGWQDEDGKTFVYFTLEEAQEQLACGHSKAVRLFAELERSGLIRRKRQGQGKPTKIYVENLLGEVFFPEAQNDGNEETAWEEPPSPSESQTSALPENVLPDFPEPDANKTEKNDTELSETDRIYPPYTPPFTLSDAKDSPDGMDGIEDYKTRIKANISYGILLEQRPNDRELIDGYVELLAEACASRRKTIRISWEDFPAEAVCSRFLKLNSEHIGYVLDCMKHTTGSIGNIKAYILAALYNAPVTMGQYYASLVSRDLAAEGVSTPI